MLLEKETLPIRPRRARRTDAIRRMVEETMLRPSDLVAPLFLIEGENRKEEIPSLPGIYRMTIDQALKTAERYHALGVPAVNLFPAIDAILKDADGSYALCKEGLIPCALQAFKTEIPSLCLMADVALDPFTSHGHDGVIDEDGYVLNDQTVQLLSAMSLVYAEAGADVIAPSDMMDGRIGAIRKTLDYAGLESVAILSYTAKYASALYGPFRDALRSGLKKGDKKSYQMNPANRREAVRQAELDVEQGADMVMVKPALFYLDVIAEIRSRVHVPVAAYHVSGEYAQVMAAHSYGWLDAPRVFFEALLSIKRAGADFILTYALDQVLPLLAAEPF